MPRKPDPSTPRRPCVGWRRGTRQCWARPDSGHCRNHDPAEAERRAAAGAVRHPRFAKAVVSDGHSFNASKVPTIPHVIDRAMGIAASAERGDIDPRNAQAAVSALRLAFQALAEEREHRDRLKWAWEREGVARRAQGDARENSSILGEGSSPEAGSTETPAESVPEHPPWVRPRQTQ